jgi:hypothetical protein
MDFETVFTLAIVGYIMVVAAMTYLYYRLFIRQQ